MIRVSLHCTYGMFAKLHFGANSNSMVNMAENVNDKGDSRTIQQIVRAVVANLNFIKVEVLRFLRTNYSQFTFEENMSNFKTRLQNSLFARDVSIN